MMVLARRARSIATSTFANHNAQPSTMASSTANDMSWPVQHPPLSALGGAAALSASTTAIAHIAAGAGAAVGDLGDDLSVLFRRLRHLERRAAHAVLRPLRLHAPGRADLPAVMVLGAGGGRVLRYGDAIAALLDGASRVSVTSDGEANIYLRPAGPGPRAGAALPLCSDVSLPLPPPAGGGGGPAPAPGTVRVAAVALPVNAQGDVLVTQRVCGGGVYDGVWVFPGGHTERREGLAAAAAREAREEAGVAVDPASLTPLAVWEGAVPARRRQFCVVFFAAHVAAGAAAAALAGLALQPKEVSRAAWVPRALVRRLLDPGPDPDDDPEVQAVRAPGPGEPAGGQPAAPVRLSELRRGLGGGHRFALRAFLSARPEYFAP
jgi:8-oxo-dGTP pyrophosphatase MutT (NUDIX family)